MAVTECDMSRNVTGEKPPLCAITRARVVISSSLELTSQSGVGPSRAKPPLNPPGSTGPRITDRRGERFGRLVVVDYAWDRPGQGWRCRCDCGNERVVKYALLRRRNNVSCGCVRRERFRSMENPSRLPDGEASFRQLLGHYRRNASKRGHVFELSEPEFRALTLADCAYCGLAPTRQFRAGPKSNGPWVCNGVDRVDNDAGYTRANSVPCCPDCNMAKGAMPIGRWQAMLRRIAQHQPIASNHFKSQNEGV